MAWSPKPGVEFTLVNETMDGCDQFTELNYSCPIKQGHYVFHVHGKVPGMLPKVHNKFLSS